MDKRETGGKGHSGQSIGSLTTQAMIINFINENADFQEKRIGWTKVNREHGTCKR